MPGPLAIQHLNSCVYEIIVDENGDSRHLYKQLNNAIPVIGVMIERYHDITYNSIKDQMTKRFSTAPEPLVCMAAYPLTEEDYDKVGNFTVVYGWMQEMRKKDPTQPIAVPVGDPEGHEAAMRAALMAYPVAVPFVLVFMETGRYMFDITLSHIPQSAITEVPNVNEAEESLPSSLDIGVEPQSILPPEDMALMRDISHYVREYLHEHPDCAEESFNMALLDIVMKVSGKNKEDAEALIARMNAAQAKIDQANGHTCGGGEHQCSGNCAQKKDG